MAEDNPGDVALFRAALHAAQAAHRLSVAPDGVDALAHLRHPAPPRPDLALLDRNLPRRDGRAVLGAMRADPALRAIPVVVFSTSTSPQDVAAAYAQGANAFIAKPFHLDDFFAAVRAIVTFWGAVAPDGLPADGFGATDGRLGKQDTHSGTALAARPAHRP